MRLKYFLSTCFLLIISFSSKSQFIIKHIDSFISSTFTAMDTTTLRPFEKSAIESSTTLRLLEKDIHQNSWYPKYKLNYTYFDLETEIVFFNLMNADSAILFKRIITLNKKKQITKISTYRKDEDKYVLNAYLDFTYNQSGLLKIENTEMKAIFQKTFEIVHLKGSMADTIISRTFNLSGYGQNEVNKMLVYKLSLPEQTLFKDYSTSNHLPDRLSLKTNELSIDTLGNYDITKKIFTSYHSTTMDLKDESENRYSYIQIELDPKGIPTETSRNLKIDFALNNFIEFDLNNYFLYTANELDLKFLFNWYLKTL